LGWDLEENDKLNGRRKWQGKRGEADFEFHGGLVCLVFWLLIEVSVSVSVQLSTRSETAYKRTSHLSGLIAYNKQKELRWAGARHTCILQPYRRASAVRILK